MDLPHASTLLRPCRSPVVVHKTRFISSVFLMHVAVGGSATQADGHAAATALPEFWQGLSFLAGVLAGGASPNPLSSSPASRR